MTQTDSTTKIDILPEHIIDQIKAGEVLERPASLIKELIENSLDAKASEINIHLVENGMSLLSIEDNGHGMSFENLPYAFLRHATSKLKNFEDLFKLYSFGFRGEALASVAASARVTCTSQPEDLSIQGGKIVIHGGATEYLIPQKLTTHGTSIYIKDLFYNTPARLKFVKSKTSEKAALKKIIYSFVVAHPQVTFSIKWDDKEKEIFKAVDNNSHHLRVSQVFYNKKIEQDDLICAEQIYDRYKIKVFYTLSTYSTPQFRHHYLFANKRFFQDKSLHQAILRNLDGLWRFGDSGHYFIDIEVPPEEIDVNVHPNKTQIKFMRSDVVYSLLVTTLKSTLTKQESSNNLPSLSTAPLSFSSEQHFFQPIDHQLMDMQHFSGTGQSSGHRYDYSLQKVHPVENQPLFQLLFARYIVYQKNLHQEILFIDIKLMLASYFVFEIDQLKNGNEDFMNPLLISEPFKVSNKKIDESFEIIKNLGFEFDRLNQEYIVLRSIPKFLPIQYIQMFSHVVIKFFEQKKLYQKNDFFQFCSSNLTIESDTEITPAFIEKCLLLKPEHSFTVPLTANRIAQLFKT